MKKKKIRRLLLICLITIMTLGLLGACAVFGVDAYVVNSTRDQLLTPEDASQLQDVDCILVLGCQVKSDGTPSAMLEDRLRRGTELFHAGAAPKLLMSGDHGAVTYNEVQSMKQYAIDNGVASADVFMDHAGFSTYESIYRAKDIFQAKKILIVTQEYHLYRALYIANALGLEAYGVNANYRDYSGQMLRDIREILARNKDFLTSLFQPDPTYRGKAIPIWGDGNLTNDQ
jgi:vancomycin permeability regulator SanA